MNEYMLNILEIKQIIGLNYEDRESNKLKGNSTSRTL